MFHWFAPLMNSAIPSLHCLEYIVYQYSRQVAIAFTSSYYPTEILSENGLWTGAITSSWPTAFAAVHQNEVMPEGYKIHQWNALMEHIKIDFFMDNRFWALSNIFIAILRWILWGRCLIDQKTICPPSPFEYFPIIL